MSEGPRAVLLDIEGTTTPLDFVHRQLFPYAHARVEAYLAAHADDPELAEVRAGLRAEHERDVAAGRNPPAWSDSPASLAAYARWLMDQDRKATPLKTLQGKIWAEGYARGELVGQVYEDVPRALKRWTDAGRRVAIFSSGSVLAQKLVFGHTSFGDLTPHISAFFDTTTGPKGEAASYRQIAASLGLPPADVLFVSDAFVELEAAKEAGLDTAIAIRTDTLPTSRSHRPILTFDRLL
ncbi:MAG TPA: acireductone synthase [Vicinamibacteria bacterium]